MSETMIDRLHNEHKVLIDFLTSEGEMSLINNVDASFRKALLLSAASFFEVQVRDCLLSFFSEKANDDEAVISFLKNNAIERKYHTYFDWEKRQANKFFSMFGTGFKDFMVTTVRGDNKLETSIRAFLELGELRNLLVHQDYATFPLEKTVDEIYELYKDALFFIEIIPSKLREYSSTKGT